MTEKRVKIIAADQQVFELIVNPDTTVEEGLITFCKKFEIKPICRPLFALRYDNIHWASLNSKLWNLSNKTFHARIRFKVPDIKKLLEIDRNTFDYYFDQARDDILNTRINDISYDKHKEELLGLGVTDMYRVMSEKGLTKDIVLSDYKRFIPKEVLKHHKFFVKKPMLDSLTRIEKSGNLDTITLKSSYLEQLEEMAPNYLAEEFEAEIEEAGVGKLVTMSINLYHKDFPGIQYLYRGKKDWVHLCSIEDLCCVSLHSSGTAEISRKTGIPLYVSMESVNSMVSFITLLDGYYRLSVKWTFNLCKDFITPSLLALKSIKCHGPVGGKFAYAKLEQKRDNKPGCFVLRESEIAYDTFYVDVCLRDRKPSTYRIERRGEGHYWFSGDEESYESIPALIAKHKSSESDIPMIECIPPSEYDPADSNLLLCQKNQFPSSKEVQGGINGDNTSQYPICTHLKHLQVFSGKLYRGRFGVTEVHKCLWRPDGMTVKLEVALKVLKPKYQSTYLKEFLDLSGKWGLLKSSAVVRLLGVTLSSTVAMLFEFYPLGALDLYLQRHKHIIKEVDLIEAATYVANAVWHMESEGIVHGYMRCHKILVTAHNDSCFSVRVADPGIHPIFRDHDYHFIPPEHYNSPTDVNKFVTADMWAFGTTLWQIFSFGVQPLIREDVKLFYLSGKRLDKPKNCSNEIFKLINECWTADVDQRKRPQAAMRDINQLLYQVYNSRRSHVYSSAKLGRKNNVDKRASVETLNDINSITLDSHSAEFSQNTISSYIEDTQLDADFGSLLMPTEWFQDSDRSSSPDLSSFLSNLNRNSSSLSNGVTSIFEWNEDLGIKNIVLCGVIGKGCYGEVYKAIAESVSSTSEYEQVAVKKLITPHPNSCLADFEREISIMKNLKHPNIVEMKGVLQDPEVLLIMEYVPLGSLKNYLLINKDTLNPEKHFLKYALDIAKGMAYLGQKKIVHRDLAARNVLVANEYTVKISDFGLAQVMGTNNYYMLQTTRHLPIRWYAPESLCDGIFSTSSDVWSYGVLLFEIFSYGDDPILHVDDPSSLDDKSQYSLLQNDVRLPCPVKCPCEIYNDLLMSCWRNNHKERPTFPEIIDIVDRFIKYYCGG